MTMTVTLGPPETAVCRWCGRAACARYPCKRRLKNRAKIRRNLQAAHELGTRTRASRWALRIIIGLSFLSGVAVSSAVWALL